MLSEMGQKPMIGNNKNSFGDEFEKEMSLLLREQRKQEADEELNLYRSGSAPPTVEGSFSAVSGLFNHGGVNDVDSAFAEFAGNTGSNGFSSEEELRSDPAYLSYYYSNVNLNPRLPPPLVSREDWRFAQRLQGGGGSAIGDRRKVNKNDSGRSMFSMPPGFVPNKQEVGNEVSLQGSVEWGGDGLIGLPGLGLGSKQNSIAQIFQDDLKTRSTPASGHPSRPASRNAFDDNSTDMGSVEAELSRLRRDLTSSDPIRSIQTSSTGTIQSPYSYAAALGSSLSRSSTPDHRAPSPCPTPIGGGRTLNSEKRNSFNGSSSQGNIVAALSSMSLSNGVTDEPDLINLQQSHMKNNDNVQFNMSDSGMSDIGNNSSTSSNMYLNGGVNGRGIAPRYQHQHLEISNSSFSNYGFNGHPMSPIGGSNLPPLFENAAAAASGMGNLPYPDPLYLQYLRTAEYAAALNDRNYMGNSYTDMLQKAYLANLLSPPQKSQYSVKTGVPSPHGYYVNPSFGMDFSYPGSPMASPLRQPEFNMRYSDNMNNTFASSLLEEFKSNKTRCFELSEIAGHVVDFSADQYGSRFIQQKLETATTDETNMVFQEIFPHAPALMTDVFGNYVIQKFFEHGIASQRRELCEKLFGNVLNLSLQMYGCRVIQKAIEVVDVDQKIKMVGELDGHVMRCVRDQNGNHVIQKCIECVPEEHIQFIVSIFFGQVVTLSTHPYGCRVIQRVLEHCMDENTQRKAMEEILSAVSMLAQDQYGNYVVQHVLEHGNPHERSIIIQELAVNIVQMSQQKFASNVVEKCLTFGDSSERELLVNQMLGTTDENEPLQAMMKDQFANYVVQKVLETCSDHHRDLIMSRIKVHLNALKKYTYGKHIVARVEKLVAAGERRIAAQNQRLTAA